MIKNIIFDWSGTLNDDFTSVYDAVAIVFEKLGRKPISKNEFRKEFVLPYMNFYKKYSINLSKQEVDKLYSIAYQETVNTKLYPSVKRIIKSFYKQELNMIIVSSCSKKNIVIEASDYGIVDYFGEIYADVHDKTKVIKKILKINKFELDETIYVGDMVHDIEAGKVAGIKIIVLTYGYQSREELKKYNPDYIIDNILDLKKIIKNN